MRTELITQFYCSKCGSKLSICYDQNKKREDSWEESHNTGSAVKYNDISIHPCASCIKKYTAPAKKLIDAIESINEVIEIDKQSDT